MRRVCFEADVDPNVCELHIWSRYSYYHFDDILPGAVLCVSCLKKDRSWAEKAVVMALLWSFDRNPAVAAMLTC